jgi:hypothetical protein
MTYATSDAIRVTPPWLRTLRSWAMVHMMLLQVMVSSYCKHKSNRFHPSNQGKHFIEIDTLALHVPFSNESGFVSNNVAMLIALQLEDPFETDDVVSLWQVHP